MAAHIRKGDIVVIRSGGATGKRGKVKEILRNGRARVEKLMMVKRHSKPTQKNPNGGIIDKEGSIALPNIALWCTKCESGRRARVRVTDNTKQRVCVKCDTPFSAPAA